MATAQHNALHNRRAPVVTIVLMFAGLALLSGFHFSIMWHEPTAWMLFLSVFLLFGGLSHWLRVIDDRLTGLETAAQAPLREGKLLFEERA